jgi:23S rRNA 5-hydroxycytidine C2501 synthase
MQLKLELLAPAKNKDIGIAAVNCGADALYIAGPSFGARESAGNPLSEIEELISYAHRFGVKVYVVVNTILYDSELEEARKQIIECYNIGCDAIIVQDLSILRMDIPPIPLFASTQTNIRTPEQAMFLESLGFRRLILARELSLEQIGSIRRATKCELESFVQGALCVSYSGQCYMSQFIAGRSANRGCCIQACRSNYDLMDDNGNTLIKNKPLLSLKDLSLGGHIEQLVNAGISSFKIEGRLKNASYVKNVTKYWREKIDNLNYKKTSFGKIEGGFTPNISATFNRGFTDFFIDGKRGNWNSKESTKSLGEFIGNVTRITSPTTFEYKGKKLSNGDGLIFVPQKGENIGMRADIVEGKNVTIKDTSAIFSSSAIYRNFNIDFEKELDNNLPRRVIETSITFHSTKEAITVSAIAEGGIEGRIEILPPFSEARNQDVAISNITRQLNKSADIFNFTIVKTECPFVPFLPISTLNSIRRELAKQLSEKFLNIGPERCKRGDNTIIPPSQKDYLNCSNHISQSLYHEIGITPEAAYEIDPKKNIELMRTKYCLRHELGICLKTNKNCYKGGLYLVNQNNKFILSFDCKKCEMVIY